MEAYDAVCSRGGVLQDRVYPAGDRLIAFAGRYLTKSASMPLGGLDEALGYKDALRSTSLRVAAYSPDSLDAIRSELRKGAT